MYVTEKILYVLGQENYICLCLKHQRSNYKCVHAAVNFIQGQLFGSGQLNGYRMVWSRCMEYGIKMKDASLILRFLDPVRVVSGE